MFGFSKETGRPALLIGTIKAVAAVAILSFFAANWLSTSGLDQSGLSRLASATSREDPQTTGSLTKSIGQTRLDPCVMPPRRP